VLEWARLDRTGENPLSRNARIPDGILAALISTLLKRSTGTKLDETASTLRLYEIEWV
jgi:hypothetical protein